MNEPTIYAKAIEILRRRGWAKGAIRTREGRVCVEGALRLACHGNSEVGYNCCGKAESALGSSVGSYRSTGYGETLIVHPSPWNDAPERTEEDVILLLKYADAGELETWKVLYGPEATT